MPIDPAIDPLEALPHGPSFRFVDRLTALDPGKSGTGIYDVRGDEAFLAGHFPGFPIVPGVVLIEALAQLAGVVAQCDPQVQPLDDLKLAAVRAAKITGSAGPGERLEINVHILGRLGSLIQAQGSVASGGRLLLTAQISLGGSERAGVKS
jgi:3-hydroxyacyl-[acyl-carrier-protein] dehydratase